MLNNDSGIIMKLRSDNKARKPANLPPENDFWGDVSGSVNLTNNNPANISVFL